MPRRPLVFLVDFDSLHGRFSSTGRSTFPVRELRASDGELAFEVHLGGETIPVRLRRDAATLRGLAEVGGEQRALALDRLPDFPPPRDRVEAWRQDLDVVLNRFLLYDRSFDSSERAAFVQRLETLRDSVAHLRDDEITVELARAVALSNNAHTRLYLVRNRTEVRRMPFRIWHFADGWFVVRATDEHRDLLGCRLIRVNSLSVDSAAQRLHRIKPGNDPWQRYMSTYMLTSTEILTGAGIAPVADTIRYGIDCDGRAVDRAVTPLPLQRSSSTVESWWHLSPSDSLNAAVPRSALHSDSTPLYLRNPEVHYWFESLPTSGVLYFQYNRSENIPGGPPLREFATALLEAADRPGTRALVVDLRFNTGGNLGTGTPLIRSLLEKFAGRPVFVITGYSTFSAGITHAVQLKEGGARIVGEPVGDVLDTWSEGGNILLPNSGLTIHFTNGFHGYSRQPYPELEPFFQDLNVDTVAPDLPAPLSWHDYIRGEDPALVTIERELAGTR